MKVTANAEFESETEAPEMSESGASAQTEHISFKGNSEKIINFIVTDDWENVLMILAKDMDPWDVDLVELSGRFTSFVKTLHKRDLRAPSRIILAAAIIYRLKSETLKPEEAPLDASESGDEIAFEDAEGEMREPLVLPPIEIPLKRETRRKVSLRELVNALGKAMKIKNRREAKKLFNMEFKGEDITKRIEEIYETILSFIEKARTCTISFSKLFESKKSSAEEKIKNFSSILHLSNQERIVCTQETLFGEILIEKAEAGNAALSANV